MSREDYSPNERIIDRVVFLWASALRKPKFDNGDNSMAGGMAGVLASMLPNNSDDETLAAFSRELKSRLMVQFTEPPYRKDQKPYTHWITDLEVDYGPCNVLAEAANAAGLKTQFPWKTRMTFWIDHLYFSQGYAAGRIYHYPASDDRWVVTSLYGDECDVAALVQFAESGAEAPFFRLEAASELIA
jgi:hypothetical protein